MRLLSILLLLAVLGLVFAPACAQDPIVPKGVRYKRTSEAENANAKALLQRFCTGQFSEDEIAEIFGETSLIICSPGLWAEVKGDAKDAGINSDIAVKAFIPVKDSNGKLNFIEGEGAGFRTEDSIPAFLQLFGNTCFAGCEKIEIRKATTSELRYYWARIAFDIEEPIFVVVADGRRYIIDISIEDNAITSVWVDTVGDA